MTHPDTNFVPRRRNRRRLLVVFALAAFLAGGVFAWRNIKPVLSDGERELVGTWKYHWNNGSQSAFLPEYEFRADRTCVIRHFDPKTGAPSGSNVVLPWRRTGDKLTVRQPVVNPAWPVLPLLRHLNDVSILTPDGPDRYRYVSTFEHGGTPLTPPVAGTMTRVAPAP